MKSEIQNSVRYLLAIAGLGGLLYGIDFGVIAAASPYIKALRLFSDAELSWIVGIDNFAAGRALGEHVVAQGAKRVRFLMRPECATVIRDRLAGAAFAVGKPGGSTFRKLTASDGVKATPSVEFGGRVLAVELASEKSGTVALDLEL